VPSDQNPDVVQEPDRPHADVTEEDIETERLHVLDRVKGIYRVVKQAYMNNGHYGIDESLDKSYCSESWNELLMAVHRKEERTNTLFFDVDYWVMSQEMGVVVFDEFKVESLSLYPEKTASVTFTIYDSNSYIPAKIDLVYENGLWVIDNFIDLKYLRDTRESMEKFIKNDL
jgi:hypothetical protein